LVSATVLWKVSRTSTAVWCNSHLERGAYTLSLNTFSYLLDSLITQLLDLLRLR
jgi:hypothetical protein